MTIKEREEECLFKLRGKMSGSQNWKREMIILTVSCLADYPPCFRPPLYICLTSNMSSTSSGQHNVADLLHRSFQSEVDDTCLMAK